MTAISHPAPNPASLQALKTNIHETTQDWLLELAFIQDEMQFLERIIWQAALGKREKSYEQLVQKLQSLNEEYIAPLCLSLQESLSSKRIPKKALVSAKLQDIRQQMNAFSEEYKTLKKAVFQKVEDISSVEIW